MIIDIKGLYDKYGESLAHCDIAHDGDYHDIVYHGEICAMDGEEVRVMGMTEHYVELSVDGFSTFVLSMEEYKEGVAQ